MEKKECRALLGSLSDYIDGTAGDELCRELERHLAECEDCRIVVDTLKKTVYLYHANTETNLPVGVRERLFKRLNLDEFLKIN
jgi:predicted anti-sigma-YlaC factor YlaD